MSTTRADKTLAAIDHLDTWTGAWLKKAGTGRGKNGKLTPYGIQKLRELILELAVRGRLVPQDPNDEPASVLLEQIAEEKARLVKEGEIKKQKKLPEIAKNEKPFDLPEGWVWARLGEITPYGVTDKAEAADVSQDTWVLELEDIEKTTSVLLNRVRFSDRKFKSTKNKFSAGDVLYGKLRPYLDKVIVADEDGVCTTEIIPIKVLGGLDAWFLRLLLKSPDFIRYANESTHGMNLPRLGTDKARLALLPVAPLAEQHRIVAKVDELMALCDRLEQEQTGSLEAHQTLVETLLRTLVEAPDAKAAQQAWARIAQHFDTLFTTEHSIDQLKQTILQLAVMGKLVPQDPNDEPASVLLERIAEKKVQLVKEGKIKRQKQLPEVKENERPFKLPVGWKWAHVGDLGLGSTGKTPSTKIPEYYGGDLDFIGPGQISTDGMILCAEKKLTEEGGKNSVIADPGDILMVCIGGSIGKSAIASTRVAFNQQINSLKPLFINVDYIHCVMNDSQFRNEVLRNSTGSATPIINRAKWEKLLVPVPPLAEQHRIVAKVDELMALCDTLKVRLREAEATRVHLADAAVSRAVAG